MGLRAIIARVIDQVPRATPTTDATQTFCVIDDGNGSHVRLEDMAALGTLQDRVCDVRLTGGPSDDGQASTTSAAGRRLRASLAVRRWYWLGDQSRTWIEQMMAEDDAALMARLGDSANWDASTTLTDSWTFARSQPTTTEGLAGEGTDRRVVGFIRSLPFEVIYREA